MIEKKNNTILKLINLNDALILPKIYQPQGKNISLYREDILAKKKSIKIQIS